MNAGGISTKVTTVTPTKQVPAPAVGQLASANARRIAKMLTIELTKGHSGLGFSITTSDNPARGNSPIYIKDVLPKGAAIEDGRLRPGDRILEVNGTPMTGKNQIDPVAMLCNIPLGKTVQLVVSREETETVEVESKVIRYALADSHSAGLGVILMGKSTSPANGSVDLGIFIKSIIPGSTAYKDGLLQTNDQLVNINGISLLGMSNSNAMETVRNAIAQYILLANENGNDPNAQRPEVPHRNNNNTYGYRRKDKLLMPSLEEKKSNYPPTLSSIQGESMMIEGVYKHNVKKTADSHPVTGNAVENLNVVPSGSQLSLDESSPGFVRDGFGQQSMSEKSMHARSTVYYQCSKKAREEKDKHQQSCKLAYTQEGGTEDNLRISFVTGGAGGISTKVTTVAPTKKVPASAVRQLASANASRITKMLTIELTKGHSGLGFSFTTSYNPADGNSPIYIKDVLPKGAAIEDGRLRPGDRILEVNGTPMTGKSQTDAVAILCNIPLGKTVQLVVSRQEVEETEIVEVESEVVANKIGDALADSHSAGLGVILVEKSTSPANGSVDLGIFIKSIIPGSIAYKDGLLQTNDQLVNINGISLLGMSNRNALETLRNAIAQYILVANENGNDPNAKRPEVPHSNDNNNKLQNYKQNALSRMTQMDLDILQKNTPGLPGCNPVIERLMDQGSLKRNNNNTYGYGRKDKLLMPSLEEKKSNYPPTLSSIQGESMIEGGYNHNVKKTADSHPVTGNAVENLNVVPSGSQLSLDESSPGFVRDGFGQQSISEKSMHARSTVYYQCSKKAREEKDKHQQSSKLAYTQEGGTEDNLRISFVTGGAGGISTKVTTVAPTKKVPASAVRQLASANASRITKMLTIELTKGHSGLGFSFTTSYNPADGNSPIYIKDVLPKGAAIEDGRLRPGDRILEVNGTPMTGKSQTDAVAILCNIPLGKTVQLVVSRQEVEETEIVEVESEVVANKIGDALADSHSAGLGVILVEKSTSPANGSVDLGIFIKSIIPGSIAYKDGLLQTNDQLVNINGISLLGMSNRNALETLRNAIAQYILVANENGNDPNAKRPEVPHSNDNNNKLQNYKQNALSRMTQMDLDILQKNTPGLPGCNPVIERLMDQGSLERNNNNTYGYGRKDKLLMLPRHKEICDTKKYLEDEGSNFMPDTEETEIYCLVCFQTFTKAIALKAHQRSHGMDYIRSIRSKAP